MKLWWVQRQTIVSTPKGKPVLTVTDRQADSVANTYLHHQAGFSTSKVRKSTYGQDKWNHCSIQYLLKNHTYQTRHIIRVVFLMLLVFSMWKILMFFLLDVLFSLTCNIQNHNLLQNWLFLHLLFAFYLIFLPPPHNTAVLCFALQCLSSMPLKADLRVGCDFQGWGTEESRLCWSSLPF